MFFLDTWKQRWSTPWEWSWKLQLCCITSILTVSLVVSAHQRTQLSSIHILLVCFPLLSLNLNLCPVTTVMSAHIIVVYGVHSGWRLLLWGESPPPWITAVIYSAAPSRPNPWAICAASSLQHSQGVLEGKPLNRCSSLLSLQAGWPPGEPQMRAIPVPCCTSAKVNGAACPAAPACCTPAQPLLKISVVQMGHTTPLLQSQQWDRGWDLPHHEKHHPGSRSDELPEAIGMDTSPLTIANCLRGHHSAELHRHRRGPL